MKGRLPSEQLDVQRQKLSFDLNFISDTKINSEQFVGLNVKQKAKHFQGKKVGEEIWGSELGKEFSDLPAKM